MKKPGAQPHLALSSIRRYVFALVAITILLSVILFAFLRWQDRHQQQLYLVAERYHQGTMLLSVEIKEELAKADKRHSVYLVQKKFKQITQLNDDYGKGQNALFSALLDKAKQQLAQVQSGPAPSEAQAVVLQGFAHSIEQLRRLHLLAHDASVDDLQTQQDALSRFLWWAVLLISVMGLFIVWRLIRRISLLLAEQVEVSQLLEAQVEARTATVKMQASMIEQTRDAVISTDTNGHILSWNGGAQRLFDISAKQAIGQPLALIYPQARGALFASAVFEPLLHKGKLEAEIELATREASSLTVHLSFSLLQENDKATGLVCFATDLTERKAREAALASLSARLEESNKEFEAFSYSVSHDLRTPLRSIDGFSMALLEDYGDVLDETASDYLNRVRRAAQRMGQLIDELLELSRVNRAELKPVQVNVNEMAQSIFRELANNDPQRQAELILDEDMQVQGDPRLVRVVFDNLLGNAWKFTSKKEKAYIYVKKLADSPSVFYIEDNGVGFDMRHAGKLFGAFQRLHQATQFPGTGVGLATVQRIVHRHGGRVWAESEPDKGARFYFTFSPETAAYAK